MENSIKVIDLKKNYGNKEAVMTYYKFKDGKVVHQETGATKLPQ